MCGGLLKGGKHRQWFHTPFQGGTSWADSQESKHMTMWKQETSGSQNLKKEQRSRNETLFHVFRREVEETFGVTAQ